MAKHTLVGAKFYNKETNDLIRLTRVRNGNCFVGIDTDGNIKKFTKDQLDKYEKILPVGFITFFQVGLEEGKQDVIVTLHRGVDMAKGITLPVVACRQCILDMFANSVETRDLTNVGMCMSVASCPTNVNFDIMLQYKTLIKNDTISFYLDDTIDTILSFLNTVNYDAVIRKAKEEIDPTGIRGCSESLKGLLEDNIFMMEFNTVFNIIDLKSEKPVFEMIDDTFARCNDIVLCTLLAEKQLGFKLYNIAFMRYDEYTDLSKVDKGGFIFVRNNSYDNTIYIMKFTKGEKVAIRENVNNSSDEELIYKMANLASKA